MSNDRTAGKGKDRVGGESVCRAIADHLPAHPDPLIIRAGEVLKVGKRDDKWSGWIWCTNNEGDSGWVPEAYLQKEGSTFRAVQDYDATELNVKVGERLIVEKEESGWLWCVDQKGQQGWVPTESVEIMPQGSSVDFSPDPSCPFCSMPSERIIGQNELAYAVRDNFPVTPRHTLIIPRRHVSSYFDLTAAEAQACHDLLVKSKDDILSVDASVDAFNIGVNQGPAAGQTVMHCHIHLIPRRGGDVPVARGGVRHVIPGKGCY